MYKLRYVLYRIKSKYSLPITSDVTTISTSGPESFF